jgi:hypothetical protein
MRGVLATAMIAHGTRKEMAESTSSMTADDLVKRLVLRGFHQKNFLPSLSGEIPQLPHFRGRFVMAVRWNSHRHWPQSRRKTGRC